MSRQYTTEEVQEMFIDYMWTLIDFWDKESREPDARRKLEGLMHSVLATLDGCAMALPGFIVATCPHPTDQEYHQENNENWFPDNSKLEGKIEGDIAGVLHNLLFQKLKKNKLA